MRERTKEGRRKDPVKIEKAREHAMEEEPRGRRLGWAPPAGARYAMKEEREREGKKETREEEEKEDPVMMVAVVVVVEYEEEKER